MKRFLRWFLQFLETRFPEKVTVTMADYQDLKSTQKATLAAIAEIKEKIGKIELNLLNVNQSMGFAAPKFGALER